MKSNDDDLRHPSGYPYVLFATEQEIPTFFLTIDEETAKRETVQFNAGCEAKPVAVLDLITYFGHADSSRFLKKFGPEWMCSGGKVYYKKKAVNGNIV